MNRRLSNNRLAALAMLLCLAMVGPAQAAPKIVVSVAPIHSLVSALMEGVAEPELLLPHHAGSELLSQALSTEQQQRLTEVDLTIWVGPSLEANLAAGLTAAGGQVLALEPRMPLLLARPGSREEQSTNGTGGLPSYDPLFWLDPRLATQAVYIITPRLVLLDPEHAAIYLDNRIRLIERLKDLEQELNGNLAAYRNTGYKGSPGGSRYLAHRFGMGTASSLAAKDGPQPALDALGSRFNAGPELYFRLMAFNARTLETALEKRFPQRVALR